MMPTDHEALARQCEEAGADRQRELCEAAFAVLRSMPQIRVPFQPDGSPWFGDGVGPYTPEWKVWNECQKAFRAKLDAEAYVDAVLMLVPEGWNRWAVTGRHSATVGRDGDVTTQDSWVFAATPALALLCAILRSQGGKDAD